MSASTTQTPRISTHPATSSPSSINPGQYNGPGEGRFSTVSTFPAGASSPTSPTTPPSCSGGSASGAGSTSRTAVSAASPPRGNLEDRQRVVWKEMHERMDRRRLEWNSQVDLMRKDFFRLSPRNNNDDAVVTSSGGTDQRRALNVTAEGGAAGGGVGVGGTVVGGGMAAAVDKSQQPKVNVNQIVYVHPTRTAMTDSRQQFQATFDLSQYELDEISVKTDGRKLIVSARHEQNNGDSRTSFSREFSRQVDIPRHVDPTSLRCTFSKEGVLCVEASSSPSPIITTSITHHSPSALLASHYNNNNYNKVLSTSHQSLGSTSSSGGGSVAGSAGVMTSSSTPAGLPPGPIITDPDGTRRFHVEVFIGTDFQPEELTVKTVDRKLYVQAHHEETGPGRRSTSRELNREFELPDGVDPDTVTAHMTEDGILVVEAPVGGGPVPRNEEVYC